MESFKLEDQTRENQAEKVITFLDRIDAYDFFQELTNNPDKEKETTFEQFEEFLVRINGIARDISIAERTADGEQVHLEGVGSVSVPEHEDKIPLLRQAYEAIPSLADKKDAEYLLPLIINAVHLFVDGNGRTSRTIHLLLKVHLSKEEFNKELRKALGENGRFDSYDISPHWISADAEKIVLSNHGMSFGTEEDGGDPLYPPEVGYGWASVERPTSEAGRKFKKLLADDYLPCFLVAYNYLKKKGLVDQAVVNYGNEEETERMMFSPVKMDEILTPEDWEEMMNNLYVFKKEKVEVMINAFIDPQKYKTCNGTETMRDRLINKIESEYQSLNKH